MKKIIRSFIYFKVINLFNNIIKNKLLFFYYYKKKRAIIRNFYTSDKFLEHFLRGYSNYEKLRSIFYNKNVFPYSDLNEKENLVKLNRLSEREISV